MDQVIRRVDEVWPEEVLRSQDGKKVPLKLGVDGETVGEATLKYDGHRKALIAEFTIDDPKVEEFLKGDPPSIGF